MNGKKDALLWCTENRNPWIRLPLLAWGVFVAEKILTGYHGWTAIDSLDLGIHELGHLIFRFGGQWLAIAGGSIAQIIAPIFGGIQLLRQRDYFGASFCLSWLAQSLANLSLYIGDARALALPLVSLGQGEVIHDWNYLLDSMNLLNADTSIAKQTLFFAFLCNLAFLGIGSWLAKEIFRARTQQKN